MVDLIKIKRALISVSDKTGIIELAKVLTDFNVEILASGGTFKTLKEANINVKDISTYTKFPEMMDGRVKTLHPKIHGGLLALRNNENHMRQVKEHNIDLIDMVVVNLYPFEKVINKENVSIEEAIENIDIGGPSMLRSAAKNHLFVTVVIENYDKIIKELKENDGQISLMTRKELAQKVFSYTAKYDQIISNFLENRFKEKTLFPQFLTLNFEKVQDLRYGENPHQKAAFYREFSKKSGITLTTKLCGKELSYNNISDLNAAINLIKEFDKPAAAIIKHNNPCGVSLGENVFIAFKKALDCDSLSAFGGIIAINKPLEKNLAELIATRFFEAIVFPSIIDEAFEILKKKQNLILLEVKDLSTKEKGIEIKYVDGGLLVQEKDMAEENLNVVTNKKPISSEIESLLFGLKVVKYVKSNAIVLVKEDYTIGIGAGQMSRIDALKVALMKSNKDTTGAVLASDAFFPKEDVVELSAKSGISAIIQPGGSIQDKISIEVANKHNIAMIFTGVRHFLH